MLRHCLEVLSEQQKECHAPRQSMKTLLRLAKRLGVDVGADLRAERSRAEGSGDGDDIVHVSDSTPQQHAPNKVTNNNSWDNMRFAADLDEIDMAAVVDSFVFDPSEQPVFDAMGSGEFPTKNCAETQVTGRYVAGEINEPEISQSVNLESLFAANEGSTEDFFDSLFGFDVAAP
jgi:hypothetical protein